MAGRSLSPFETNVNKGDDWERGTKSLPMTNIGRLLTVTLTNGFAYKCEQFPIVYYVNL